MQAPVTPFETEKKANIFIVGVNINDRVASYQNKIGAIERLGKGIYVRADLTAVEKKAAIARNACRIMNMLHPKAVLAGSSAYHLGVVKNYLTVLVDTTFLLRGIGEDNLVHCIRSAQVKGKYELQNIEDDFGIFKMRVVTNEFNILNNFSNRRRRNAPPQTMLSPEDLVKVIHRAFVRAGSKDQLIKNVKAYAGAIPNSENAFKEAERFIESTLGYDQSKKNAKTFGVYWNRAKVASFSYDSGSWEFEYEKNFGMKITLCDTRSFAVPAFISSLLPERHGQPRTRIGDGFREFDVAERYMSNIVVRREDSSRARDDIIIDSLEGELDVFGVNGLFTGTASPQLKSVFELEGGVEMLDEHPKSARISGMQQKVTANLSTTGVLSPSMNKAFTHIVKPPYETKLKSSMGSMEWYSMAVTAMSGILTEKFAIADLGWHAPVFIAERFDIRKDFNDKSMILAEEFFSIMGVVNNELKNDADIVDVGHKLLEISTSPKEDAERLFRQTVLSYVIGNDDMHLKNLLVLKKANSTLTGYEEIRLSPAYDMLCTQDYQSEKTPALRMCGSKKYSLEDFRTFGKAMGIESPENVIMDVVLKAHKSAIQAFAYLPPVILNHEMSMKHIENARKLIENRAQAFHYQISNLNSTRRAPSIKFG